MEAEAKGLYEILTKQAEGYREVVSAAGGDSTKPSNYIENYLN
jgi:flotillin